MNIESLQDCLEYSDSPNYLTGSILDSYPAYSHAFRLAKEKCGLHGVYTLKGPKTIQSLPHGLLPVVYVCKATSEAKAVEFHKLIWNQNIVPFFLVETPKCFRLYPGFRYDVCKGIKEDQKILEIAKTANEILSNLSEFKASAIDSGAIWTKWGEEVNLDTRVDIKLLKSLKILSQYLQKNNLPRNTAHALIGKYVYLHYLKDRDILSDRKLAQWGLGKDSVFGRKATLKGFNIVTERLDNWLNGTVFPIPKESCDTLNSNHIKMVAGTFSGDDPETHQMHLDFKAYDFQHIPIETLSMVYQQFLHSEGKGRGQGAFYTPIHLVNFILDELDAETPLHKGMKVCDPACGSGAFLVQCYRRVIEHERKALQGKPLSPIQLKNLLTDLIYGVDVDEDACGVTELSLILTLLDYVDPPDLEKQAYAKFTLPTLRNNNVFHCEGGFFDTDSCWHSTKPANGYDWIVGNPPWKKLNLNPKNQEKGDKSALEWIKKNETRFPVSSNQLAEAFAWGVSQYLSNKGQVGLLMPASTLFKTNGKKFRQRFFSSFNVRCIVNFSNLRHILFQGAVNPAAVFFYSNPDERDNINSRITTYAPFAVNQITRFEKGGERRRKKIWSIVVNSNEIKELLQAEVAKGDSLSWKLAMWGSHRDRFLLLSLAKAYPSLKKFKIQHELKIHPGLELRAVTEENEQLIKYLKEVEGKKELNTKALRGYNQIFVFPEQVFQTIEHERSYVRKRGGLKPLQICYPPHIIISAARKFAVFSNEFFVVPPRQIGIVGKDSQVTMLKALALYLNSDFVLYHQFLSSTYWGVERDRPDKTDLENLPIPLCTLSEDELSSWAQLYDELAEESLKLFSRSKYSPFDGQQKTHNYIPLKQKLNHEVYRVLGIRDSERWLIEDLLFVRKELNEGKLAKEAIKPANEKEIENYANVLKKELDSFLDADIKDQHRIKIFCDKELAVVEIHHPEKPPAGTVEVIIVEDNEIKIEFDKLKKNLLRERSQWIYFNHNMKVYRGRTTYLIKPPQRLSWLKSQALLDADEFIAEKLTGSGVHH